MMLTGAAAHLPTPEQALVFEMAARLGVQPTLLAAIRLAENGGPGREFGVLDPAANTIEKQAEYAARSILHNMYRYLAQTQTWPTTPADLLSDAFIVFMQERWAPRGAANDPHDLNAHWVANVMRAYKESGLA